MSYYFPASDIGHTYEKINLVMNNSVMRPTWISVQRRQIVFSNGMRQIDRLNRTLLTTVKCIEIDNCVATGCQKCKVLFGAFGRLITLFVVVAIDKLNDAQTATHEHSY